LKAVKRHDATVPAFLGYPPATIGNGTTAGHIAFGGPTGGANVTDQLSAEAVYLRLGSLIAEPPNFYALTPTPETHRWIAQVLALIEAGNLLDMVTLVTFKVASQHLLGVDRSVENGNKIVAIAHQALAKAELAAPAELQGAFIAAGHSFDAFAAVGKALGTATSDVCIVDPYADAKLLTDYAVLSPENVSVRVLAEAAYSKSLKPAAAHWTQQMKQPLEVRISAKSTLHDRAIMIDGKVAFSLGQSFKDLVARSHTTLVRLPEDAGKLKIEAYELMWSSATPI
jgi:hypothetical protein